MNQPLPVPPPPAYVYLPTGSTAISNPMDMYGYTKCRIYLKPGAPANLIDMTVKGSPNELGSYADELDPNARKSSVQGETSYVLHNISRFLRMEAANISGTWAVWVVPML